MNSRHRRVGVVVCGVIPLAGAVYNATYTLFHAEESYRGFYDMAWLAPYRWLIREVIQPNAELFTLALIAFEVAVGLAILSRRWRRVGLLAWIAFLAGLFPALTLWPYAVTNVPPLLLALALLPTSSNTTVRESQRGLSRSSIGR